MEEYKDENGRTQGEAKVFNSAKEAMDSLLRVVGRSSETLVAEGILEALRCEHPTNQQSFGRVLQKVIINYGKKTRGVDGRNEAFRNFCESLSTKCQCEHLPYI